MRPVGSRPLMKIVAQKRSVPSSSGDRGQFDSYEERFVSLERHQRIVHYYLRRQGRETLAVVGTEKSPRHLNYVVQTAFLDAVGLTSRGELMKWRTRREVLEWLDTFLKEPQQTGGHAAASLERAPKRMKKHKKSSTVTGKLPPRQAESWLGDNGQVHFSSVQHQHFTIAAHDFVRTRGARVGYVKDLLQAEGEDKILEVRWLEPAGAPNERELLLTESTGRVPLNDVVGPAAVLSQAHWDCFASGLPEGELQHVFFCSSENAGVSVPGLKGYWTQRHASQVLGDGVLSSLRPPRKRPPAEPSSPPQLSSISNDLSWGGIPKKKRFTGSYTEEKDVDSVRKKKRRGRPPKLLTSSQSPKLLTSSPRSPKPIHGGTKRVQGSPTAQWGAGFGGFVIGDMVETLCEDSGLRGCWFRGQVIAVAAPRRLKIRYEELEDEEGSSKLEEWVTVSRSSTKDSLDLRVFGRSRVRPRPPSQTVLSDDVAPGTAVDAWWNDGWWEGVVAAEKNKKVGVFFPGERDSAWFQPGDLRLSKEWVEGAWKEVPGLEDLSGLKMKSASEEAESEPITSVKAETFRAPEDGVSIKYKASRASENGVSSEDERQVPTTPAVCEPQKTSAVLALCSFPVKSRSLPAALGIRKLGPSNLGRTSKGEGAMVALKVDTEGFECLEKMEDEDEEKKWGIPPAKNRPPLHVTWSDAVQTPEGKEGTLWTPSPSNSPAGEVPSSAVEGASEKLVLGVEAQPVGETGTDAKEAREAPRSASRVKRLEVPLSGQQSCSMDAGPAKASSHPQPILSR